MTKCPWCGATGPDFDESPMPSDYCGHDPALTQEKTMIGFIMRPKVGVHLSNENDTIAYGGAVCVSLDPFVLVSLHGETKWADQRMISFEPIGIAPTRILEKVRERLERDGMAVPPIFTIG